MDIFEIFWTIILSVFFSIIAITIYLNRRNRIGEATVNTGLTLLVTSMVLFGGCPDTITTDEIEKVPFKKVAKINNVTVAHVDLDTWITSDNKEIYATPDSLICANKIDEINMYGNLEETEYEMTKCKNE